MDTSTFQPKPVVVIVTVEWRSTLEEGMSPLSESSEDLPNWVYDASCYIVPTGQIKPELVLSTWVDISVVREDSSSQGLDDLAELEEDLDNLQFFDEQDQRDVQIGWFDLNRSIDNSRWLSDKADKEKGTEMKLEGNEAGIAVVAERADEKGKLPENAGMENSAQELGTVSMVDTEQEAALKQFEWERVEDNQKAILAQYPVGDTYDVRVMQTKLINCLLVAEGVWWDDDDLHLAHTDED